MRGVIRTGEDMPDKRTEMIQVLLNEEELRAIDAWRFDNRMPSRSASIRALLHVGLKARSKTRIDGNFNAREVGVIEAPASLQAALGTGERKKVLIVEDEYLIAAGLESIVEGLGYEVVGPAGSTKEAKAILKDTRPAAAILDVDLGKETSFAIAAQLKELAVPIVFCTGVKRKYPDGLKDVRTISKPYVKEEIDRFLKDEVA